MLYDNLAGTFKNASFEEIIGQEAVKKQVKSALIAGHHLVLAGSPGVGKTTLAKNIAKLLPAVTVAGCSWNCSAEKPLCPYCLSSKGSSKKLSKTRVISGEERFVRVQGSPDLAAEDLFGDIDPIKALEFGPLSIEAFTPGKLFKANNGILFFDELNRAPEKLQNALLQVLEEGKVTLGSYDVDFPAAFLLIATMNPRDASTEKLSDVLLDRLDVVQMSYPETFDMEKEIVLKKGNKIIFFPEELLGLVVEFVRQLRSSDDLEKVPSVRASLALYERAQSSALVNGRDHVTFEDLNESVVSVLAHRIILKPRLKHLKEPASFIKESFSEFLRQQHLTGISKKQQGDGL